MVNTGTVFVAFLLFVAEFVSLTMVIYHLVFKEFTNAITCAGIALVVWHGLYNSVK